MIVDSGQTIKIDDSLEIGIFFFQFFGQLFQLHLGLNQFPINLFIAHVQQAQFDVGLMQQFRNRSRSLNFQIEILGGTLDFDVNLGKNLFDGVGVELKLIARTVTEGCVLSDGLAGMHDVGDQRGQVSNADIGK